MLDPLLIKEFREKANNSHYVFHKYHNQNGKNRWSIICSAMDWLTVAVNNYNDVNFDKDDIDKYCMQVYSLISTIDIIGEATKQLHRVLIDNKSVPFKDEKKIFTQSMDKDDNEYFKHLRAVFGAHSINLKDDNDEKWFASWPTKDRFGDYDLQVWLYPLASEKHSVQFGLYLKELSAFAESRYNYLNVLIERIQLDFDSYIQECKQEKIKFLGKPLEDALLCKDVLNQRLPNDYFESMIEDTIRFLRAPNSLSENQIKVNHFLSEVEKALIQIKADIQNLTYEERSIYNIFQLSLPDDEHYAFAKFFEGFHGKDDALADFYLETISDYLKPYVTLNPNMDEDEIYLLIHVGLYEWNLSN